MVELAWLELSGFRSYGSLCFSPKKGINVLVGSNAAGKTNLLEAVGYLGLMASFRKAPDEVLIKEGGESAIVRGEFHHEDRLALIEVALHRDERRRVQVNGPRLTRFADILTHVRTVVFQPDDLDIAKHSPSYRRDFLDNVAVQLWPGAAMDLADYQRTLRQRNAFVKQAGPQADRRSLDVWNEQLAEAGSVLFSRRAVTIETLAPFLSEAYQELAGASTKAHVVYTSSWGGDIMAVGGVEEWKARLWEALEGSVEKDLVRRTTTVGLHRDDPMLLLDERNTRTHASQGEQRSLVLALRLAQQSAISQGTGLVPVTLLDDVFSELDLKRARALAVALPEGQTFITTARDEEVPIKGKRWSVKEGSVE
jgi:DNA replication and repair protein RecF